MEFAFLPNSHCYCAQKGYSYPDAGKHAIILMKFVWHKYYNIITQKVKSFSCIQKPANAVHIGRFLKLQQGNAGFGAGLDGLFIPNAGLHLADVAAAQHQHCQPGLTDAAADGQRQFVIEEHLMEGELSAVIAAG